MSLDRCVFLWVCRRRCARIGGGTRGEGEVGMSMSLPGYCGCRQAARTTHNTEYGVAHRTVLPETVARDTHARAGGDAYSRWCHECVAIHQHLRSLSLVLPVLPPHPSCSLHTPRDPCNSALCLSCLLCCVRTHSRDVREIVQIKPTKVRTFIFFSPSPAHFSTEFSALFLLGSIHLCFVQLRRPLSNMSVRPVTGMRSPAAGMGFSSTGSSHAGSMRPTTTMGGGTTLGRIQAQVQEGTFTSTVYGYIRDHQYEEAVELLASQLEEFPRSRAAVSLMAYCYYMMGDYGGAASLYEQLTKICPNIEEYRVYYAQSLYKAGAYAESNRLCTMITSPQNQAMLNKLQAAIAYEQDDIPQTKSFVEQAPATDTDMLVLRACVLSKEGSYEEALEKFKEAQNAVGFSAALAYNMALMYYKMEQYGPALRHLSEIIDRGVEEHPELNIGTNTEGGDARSVGNTQLLRETALIEAFNLKAAIEYASKNTQAAKEALTDMPPRTDEELDPVTLHNTALINMDGNPTSGFKKFNFLLQNPPFPPETFQNLLLFYCKYQYYDLAADVLAENPHLAWQYLSQNNQSLYDFLDGLITAQTSPAEAYRKFDILAQKMVQQLRNMTRRIQEADQSQDAAVARTAVRTYDVTLEEYIPVLMAQANIYWEMENYPMVEQLFRQSADFCSENEVWKQNVAHVFFMQETKFKEAIRYYLPVVEASRENILNCSAIVLANLCVSYIMTAQNEQAEDIMRRIERAEERLTYEDSSKQPLHLCIVNLVIGTLYCSKGNFEFGISRIIKSLEPYDRKIMTDTWFYAKRCFLALAMNLAKHMVILKDSSFEEIIFFFDQVDLHGEKVAAFIHPDPSKQDTSPRNTARWEARQLKKLYLTLTE